MLNGRNQYIFGIYISNIYKQGHVHVHIQFQIPSKEMFVMSLRLRDDTHPLLQGPMYNKWICDSITSHHLHVQGAYHTIFLSLNKTAAYAMGIQYLNISTVNYYLTRNVNCACFSFNLILF